ncbi:MAG: hypothetical protein Q8N94_10025 [Methanoregula sp.]|nr:hypothetical protein [Methanoregula sp.]
MINAAFAYWSGVTMSLAGRVIANAKIPVCDAFGIYLADGFRNCHGALILYRVRQVQVIVLCF